MGVRMENGALASDRKLTGLDLDVMVLEHHKGILVFLCCFQGSQVGIG